MPERGFSLIEILTVMIMVGLMVAIAIPRFGRTLSHGDVRGARNLFTTMHAKARASAVSRGRRTAFAIRNGELAILSAHPVSGVIDTIGSVDDLVERFGVTYTVNPPTRDTLVFDARGLGGEATSTTIIVSKADYADTIDIAPLGRVMR